MSKPTFEETVLKAAQAIYDNTHTGQSIRWDFLPQNVQEEMQTIARIAITVALVDLRDSILDGTAK
jgi:hypothetical protein